MEELQGSFGWLDADVLHVLLRCAGAYPERPARRGSGDLHNARLVALDNGSGELQSRLAFRPWAMVACVVALLGLRNVGEVVLPSVAYVPTNVGVGAVLLAAARRGGVSWEELGFDGRRIRRGLSVGALAGSVAIVAMLAAAALPMTRGFFDDAGVPADAPGWERLYQTVVRIPVGTVGFEELAFRGVLLAVLSRVLG